MAGVLEHVFAVFQRKFGIISSALIWGAALPARSFFHALERSRVCAAGALGLKALDGYFFNLGRRRGDNRFCGRHGGPYLVVGSGLVLAL